MSCRYRRPASPPTPPPALEQHGVALTGEEADEAKLAPSRAGFSRSRPSARRNVRRETRQASVCGSEQRSILPRPRFAVRVNRSGRVSYHLAERVSPIALFISS